MEGGAAPKGHVGPPVGGAYMEFSIILGGGASCPPSGGPPTGDSGYDVPLAREAGRGTRSHLVARRPARGRRARRGGRVPKGHALKKRPS